MNCERVSKAFYIEGLTRLAANVKNIEYHKTAWQYANHVCRQTDGDFDARQRLPELATWRTFCSDMIAELKAAYDIGRREFQVELLNCYKLSLALENSYCRDDEQILLDTIVELDIAAACLLSQGSPAQHDNQIPLCRVEMVEGGMRIDQVTIALKPKQFTLLTILVEASGEFVALDNHGYRSRDIEKLPAAIQEVIEAQPGAGTRILPKWLN